MIDRLGSLGLLSALAVAVVLGCSPAETPDPLDSLIARHVEARGGMERLEAIESIRMTGRAIAGPGRQALVTREVRPPGRIRTEFVSQGVTAVYACDGSRCWFVDPLSGVFDAELMSAADTSISIEQADIVGPLFNWKEKGHSVELLGKVTLDGGEAFKLEVTLSGGGVQTDYLDAETALLVRRETTRTFGERVLEVRATFSDFRPVEGVVFAHALQTGAIGETDYLEIVVEGAEINVPLDDTRFDVPG
jgi:outer membrane lipoprotein-sorting protein